MPITATILESIEALERLDLAITDTTTRSDLQQMLIDQFGEKGLIAMNLEPSSITKLAKITSYVQKELMPYGVNPVRVEYPSGKVITRFNIAGSPGLWGAENVNEYLQRQQEQGAAS